MAVTGKTCIMCERATFLDPKKEICYKVGGLFCRKLKKIVGKYDACHADSDNAKKAFRKRR